MTDEFNFDENHYAIQLSQVSSGEDSVLTPLFKR